MKVWVLEIITMNGSQGFYSTAYLHKPVAIHYSKKYEEEWNSYKPVEKEGQTIEGNRIIINRMVYDLDYMTPEQLIKKRAMDKLTDEEKLALGLKE
jgi:hypothetical protein